MSNCVEHVIGTLRAGGLNANYLTALRLTCPLARLDVLHVWTYTCMYTHSHKQAHHGSHGSLNSMRISAKPASSHSIISQHCKSNKPWSVSQTIVWFLNLRELGLEGPWKVLQVDVVEGVGNLTHTHTDSLTKLFALCSKWSMCWHALWPCIDVACYVDRIDFWCRP